VIVGGFALSRRLLVFAGAGQFNGFIAAEFFHHSHKFVGVAFICNFGF
jgi:hypothetical protein